jgi:hypothetical protein
MLSVRVTTTAFVELAVSVHLILRNGAKMGLKETKSLPEVPEDFVIDVAISVAPLGSINVPPAVFDNRYSNLQVPSPVTRYSIEKVQSCPICLRSMATVDSFCPAAIDFALHNS